MIAQEKLDFLVRLIVEAVHPERIILFGSAARGTMGPHSDLDVLVIMPDGADWGETTDRIYRHLRYSHFGHAVDIVVATRSHIKEYGDINGLIFKDALQEGHQLYAA